ncbi:MAG: lysophospholipid acyltransferase family protein [Candidatus Cloacimonetes bacterium]|nr:lysophospholipid acyltransferase family protein [Candidatus Cloacimonadota bacterium]
MKITVRYSLEKSLFQVCYFIMSRLPYNLVESLLEHLFLSVGYGLGIRRKVAESNLRLIYPEITRSEVVTILRKMYRHFGKMTAELFFADNEKLMQKFEFRGDYNMWEALAQQRGVILATAHLGNWELAGRFLAQHFQVAAIYKRLHNQFFDRFTYDIRKRYNVTPINKKKALLQTVKCLRENFVVTILIDQYAGKKGIKVDFMGFPASTYVGAAKLAIRTGAPVVVGVAVRTSDNKHLIMLEKPIYPQAYSDSQEDVKKLLQVISSNIEKYVYNYPEQWFWVHRRWRGLKKKVD